MSNNEAYPVKQARQGTVQTAVRLPAEMMDRLRGDGRNVSDEIRRRLELAFAFEAFDPETRELAINVMRLADHSFEFSGGAWHTHAKSQEAVLEAVRIWIEGIETYDTTGSLPWGADDPKTLGRVTALALRQRKTEKWAEGIAQALTKLIDPEEI